MGINEKKMKIVIDNYFRSECNVNTSIRSAFEKGFRIGVEKGLTVQPEPTERIYKRGYADGYHKAEKDYFERTEKDRDDAFKAGVEIEKAKRKTGRWIDGSILTYAVCSECGYQERYADENNFCPNCGADMRGKQEKMEFERDTMNMMQWIERREK